MNHFDYANKTKAERRERKKEKKRKKQDSGKSVKLLERIIYEKSKKLEEEKKKV